MHDLQLDDLPATPPEDRRIRESAKIGKLLVDTFDSVGSASQLGGLESSKWASRAGFDGASDQHLRSDLASSTATENKAGKEVPPASANSAGQKFKAADVDNVDAFMVAVWDRVVLKSKKYKGTEGTEGAQGTGAAKATTSNDEESHSEVKKGQIEAGISSIAEDPLLKPGNMGHRLEDEGGGRTSKPATTATGSSDTGATTTTAPQQDREHQMVFESWGVPPPRDTPPAEIRRVILSRIPSWLLNPSSIFALVHGGRIESMTIIPNGNAAHVIFCEASACQRYYDMYPNGIAYSNNGRNALIYVDLGTNPDPMSSHIRDAVADSATRVLRGIGVDLNANMADLVHLTEGAGLKLDKILDYYSASTRVRTVYFRLCSIEHALRLRLTLSRLEDWEQVNLQWGPDPCELATEIHWD